MKRRYDKAKIRAAQNGITFSLSKTDYSRLIKRECWYCSAQPTAKEKMGLALVREDRGYSRNNTIPCCKRCRKMKSAIRLGHASFIEHTQKIANRSNGDDYKTKTTFVPEDTVGDTAKIVLLCIYDLTFRFNMQKSEVMSLFRTLLDEHIDERDHLDE